MWKDSKGVWEWIQGTVRRSNLPFVFIVPADEEPINAPATFQAESAVLDVYAHRPPRPDSLEVQ
jgi:hypothetical protein